MVASRFVAGDTLEAGMSAARELNAQGIRAMLDHLGENVYSPAQAAAAADSYIAAVKRISETSAIDCNISVKLTQLGLDSSREVCLENMERVLDAASERSILVMIDMEARGYVDRTLETYLELRARYPNVGVALQSYLYRTAEDAARIAGPKAIVRMTKGAYLEPRSVAFERREDVRRNFARVSASLLAAGSVVHLATHDERLINGAEAFIRRHGIDRSRYEFQMLFGIRRDLQVRLVKENQPVRVYIPYGYEWYPYLIRRLAERPANLWFFASNLVRGVRAGGSPRLERR